MSDLMQEPPADALPLPDLTTPSTDDDTSLEGRVAVLETKVAAIEATAEQANAPKLITTPAGVTFDTEGRVAELEGQGMSPEDAVEQAAYEERLWNDRNAPAQ